jgi:hypothetical protein
LVIAAVLLIAVIVGVVIFEMSRPSYGPGPVDIEVFSNKFVYAQGEEVNFTIYVNNPQNWSVLEPFSVTHEMNRTNELVLSDWTEIDFAERPSFPPHSRTLYDTRVWDGKVRSGDNLTLAPPVIYTYFVTFKGSGGYGNGGNCTFEIR